MLLICVTHYSRKIHIDFGFKRSTVKVVGDGRLCVPTNSFSDDKFCWIVQLYSFKFYIIMYHSSLREDPIDFAVNSSKVKVTGQGSLHPPTNSFQNQNDELCNFT